MTRIPDVKVIFAREAATVALEKLLENKTFGDRITAAEIQDATGFADWRSFGHKIRKYVEKRHMVHFAVPNDGFRIGTPQEHLDFSEQHRKSALRKEKRGVKALLSTDRTQLSETDDRRFEFALRRASTRLVAAERDDKDTKAEFKLDSSRPPRRLPEG